MVPRRPFVNLKLCSFVEVVGNFRPCPCPSHCFFFFPVGFQLQDFMAGENVFLFTPFYFTTVLKNAVKFHPVNSELTKVSGKLA